MNSTPEYRHLVLSLRPVRVACLFSCVKDWHETVLRLLGQFSGYWGGAAFLPIPVGESGQLHPAIVRVLRAYDPDRIHIDPDVTLDDDATTLLERRMSFFSQSDASPLPELRNPNRDLSWSAVRLSDVIRSQLLYPTDHPRLRGLTSLTSVATQPELRLVLAAHAGHVSPELTREYGGLAIIRERVIDDTSLTDYIEHSCDPPGVGEDPEPEGSLPTPFDAGLLGCRWYRSLGATPAQFVLVVGDDPEEFCLFFGLNRLRGNTGWLPLSAVHDSSPWAMAWRAALVHKLRLDPSSIVTSATHTPEALRGILDDLGATAFPVSPRVHDPRDVPLEPLLRVLDASHVDRELIEPFVERRLTTHLPRLQPSRVQLAGNFTPTWYVDVSIDGWRPPPRAAIRKLLAPNDALSHLGVRASSTGISYWSQRQGRQSTLRHEDNIASPTITLADAKSVFECLLRRDRLTIRPSAVGSFAAGAVELWGGLDAFAADLTHADTWQFLSSYTRSGSSTESTEPGTFLGLQKRWAITLAEAARLGAGTEPRLRTVVDRFIQRGIARRGLVLKCPLCSATQWADLQDVGQKFQCGRCQMESLIKSGTWLDKAPEPTFSYVIHEVVFQALSQHCKLPILALHRLRNGSRAFDFVFQQEVVDGATVISEIDIWAIVDGTIVIGEATIADCLEKGRKLEKQRLERLGRVANAISADRILLATSSPCWQQRTRDLASTVLTDTGCDVEFVERLGESESVSE